MRTRPTDPPPLDRERPAPSDDLRERYERLLRELRVAEQVQRSMLPRRLPSLPGVAFGAGLSACQHMAGDFYNSFRLDREHVGFYVADVMGHGPAAALLGVYSMQVIHTKRIDGHSYEILDPSEVLAALNSDLIDAEFPGEPFVTMFYGVLHVSSRRLRYCSAGHPPAMQLRPGEPPVALEEGDPLLGVFDVGYRTREVQLQPGDRLIVYSDGVDVASWADTGPGLDGLIGRLCVRDDRTPQDLIDGAMSDAVLDATRADDLTLLMLEAGE